LIEELEARQAQIRSQLPEAQEAAADGHVGAIEKLAGLREEQRQNDLALTEKRKRRRYLRNMAVRGHVEPGDSSDGSGYDPRNVNYPDRPRTIQGALENRWVVLGVLRDDRCRSGRVRRGDPRGGRAAGPRGRGPGRTRRGRGCRGRGAAATGRSRLPSRRTQRRGLRAANHSDRRGASGRRGGGRAPSLADSGLSCRGRSVQCGVRVGRSAGPPSQDRRWRDQRRG
jgi:hypothetical protein